MADEVLELCELLSSKGHKMASFGLLPTLFFKPCFSASTALSSFCTSTFAALFLEGSKLWEIMQFSSQSESVERSAMDAGTPSKNGV